VVVETVFVRPGLGTLLAEAIRARDYPVVQGSILFFAAAIVVVNIIVDIGYAIIDPRIRL
jgi:peptide/nickel transport system permease protein